MAKLVPFVIALSVLALVSGEAATQQSFERTAMFKKKLLRAYEIEPRRRDAPLRYENITDEEVREIQVAAREVVPRALVNISGVTVGCPCEDGPGCSNQVWIVAYRPDKSVGLLLSKVDGHWAIGPVQRWWLLYDDLESRFRTNQPYAQYLEEERKLFDAFPACIAPLPVPAQDKSAVKSEQ